MKLAIAQAAEGDFPFGTVIVRDGEVLMAGRNLGIQEHDPTAHGEMVAIRRFLANKIVQIMIPCAEVAKQTPFADIGITGGVLAHEALALFKS
jgi:tRNA(adenine34) deaminase